MLKRVFMLLCAAIIIATALGVKKAHADTVFCKEVHDYAQYIMAAKQYGAAVHDAVEALEGSDLPQSGRAFYLFLIQEAYTKNVYRTDRLKIRAIESFAQEWYFVCLKSQE